MSGLGDRMGMDPAAIEWHGEADGERPAGDVEPGGDVPSDDESADRELPSDPSQNLR